MAHRAESLEWRGADAPRWGIRRDEIGKCRLQFLQTAHQLVVFCVADLRAIENVVPMIMIVELLPQCLDQLLSFLTIHPRLLPKGCSPLGLHSGRYAFHKPRDCKTSLATFSPS